MSDKLLKMWIRFRYSEDGATLVEYGIAITLAVAVGTVALLALGTAISLQMSSATDLM